MAKQKTIKQPLWRKYLPVLIILAVAGGFGVWKLVDSFAATGLSNGNIYVGNGYFTNQKLGNLTSTAGFDTRSNDEPIFSPLGDTVAYVDYASQEDFDNQTMSIMSSKSDGTAEKQVYKAKKENNELIDYASISWSRDGKLLSFITTIPTYESMTESRFINVVKPDGTELKQFGFNYGASSSDGGSLKEATFSGNNPNIIQYLSYGMRLCSLDIVSEARKCNEDDISVPSSISSTNGYQQVDFYKLIASGNYLYARGEDWLYKDNGEISIRHNIYRIDASSNSALNITNFSMEQLDDITPRTYIIDVAPSPDGSKIYYVYNKWLVGSSSESTGSTLLEDKVMSINPDGTNPELLQDNRNNPPRGISFLSWQPRTAGIEAPLPPAAPWQITSSLSSLRLSGIEKKDSIVTPSFDIVNKTVVPQDYVVNVTRTMNGNKVDQTLNVSVGPEETKTVKLTSFTTPYAKWGTYAQDTGNLYTIRVATHSGDYYYSSTSKSFALPMPPFRVNNVGSSVTVKKGATVTFRGRTLPNKQVSLNNKSLSSALSSVKADADGKYTINYTAKDTRVVKVCLNTFENMANGCKKVKINVN